MKSLIDMFNVGMQRSYADILPSVSGTVLNLGAGNKKIDGAIDIDYPEWNAECDRIPYGSNSVDMIHCYHLLEHISNFKFVMSEIERVLKPRGHVNIVVPYYNSHLQASDVDHKRSFTERSFEKFFRSDFYTKDRGKPMEIVFSMIMGDSEYNLVLVTQLRKFS